MGFKLKVSR